MDGMEAYISGDEALGDKKKAEARPMWEEALKECGELAQKSKDAQQKMDDLMARPDWKTIKDQVYKRNRYYIDQLSQSQFDDYEKKHWSYIGGA